MASNHEESESLEDMAGETTMLWMTHVYVENGDVIGLNPTFFSNIWPEFWPHLNKKAKKAIVDKIIQRMNEDISFTFQPSEFWYENIALEISSYLGWNVDFFKAFPWCWICLDNQTLNKMIHSYGNTKKARNIQDWFYQPNNHNEVSKSMKELQEEALLSMYVKKNRNFTKANLNVSEEGLSQGDLYILRSLKLQYNALSEAEIPKFAAIKLIREAMNKLSNLPSYEPNRQNAIRKEDHQLLFRISVDDDKDRQWMSIMKYKGFTGELIFVELYDDIYAYLPAEYKMKNGKLLIPSNHNFEYTPEEKKTSVYEILKEIERKFKDNDLNMTIPKSIPLYYPDFYTIFQSEETDNLIVLTLFENTWSRITSQKMVSDKLKWEHFVSTFNNENANQKRTQFGFEELTVMIQIIPINVSEYMNIKRMPEEIRIRKELVSNLIAFYNQLILSHSNSNILNTIQFCSHARVPKTAPQFYNTDKMILESLEKKVDEDVFRDTGFKNYVKFVEKPLDQEEMIDFEEDLIEEIEKKLDENFITNQRKWVNTNADDLEKGIKHIESSLFDKERIIRMVSNNHHSEHQFSILKEGENLQGAVDNFFSSISDLLLCFKGRRDAKLKPTLCTMVHVSASHTTFLTNNYQFGHTEGLNMKTSKTSKVLKILNENQTTKDDPRVLALNDLRNSNKRNRNVWTNSKHDFSEYKSSVDPALNELAVKKRDIDYIHRFTTIGNSEYVCENNFMTTVNEPCCDNMNFRYNHQFNVVFVVCPKHMKRYYMENPLIQLDVAIDIKFQKKEVNTMSFKETVRFLKKISLSEGTHVFLSSHIAHFFSGILNGDELVENLFNSGLYNICHPFYKNAIRETLSTRDLGDQVFEILSRFSIERYKYSSKIVHDAKETINNWYSKNLVYLRDHMSRKYLESELESLCETNPLAVCYADFSEKLIKSRSQYFTMSNSCGYITFSKTFGPIFSSQSSADSESIKCFTKDNGYFFSNHRTLRMLQGTPLMLISNKLIVDKMANRKCEIGDYSKDFLINFCLLNSRRLNGNLQNLRYFFMACWSSIFSPYLFKKLEMDFLKTSELSICLELIRYMKSVMKNYRFQNNLSQSQIINRNKPNCEHFPLLFNDNIEITLKDTDLCLHSFYEVHLFEKTIAGKVQELRKVFKKFINPKLKWFKDREIFKGNDKDSEDIKLRYLRSDGINENFSLDEEIDSVINDTINNNNKYSGFNMKFIKCAAASFTGFSKDEFETEIRMPKPVTDLLKATSTVKTFTDDIDFNRFCTAVNRHQEVTTAMKTLNKETLDLLLKRVQCISPKESIFSECIKRMTNIKRTEAKDLTSDELNSIKEILDKIDLNDIDSSKVEELDKALSLSSYIQICENYEYDNHRTQNSSEAVSNLTKSYFEKFLNFNDLVKSSDTLKLLMYAENIKMSLENLNDCIRKLRKSNGKITTMEFADALNVAACKRFFQNPEEFTKFCLSTLNRERTPKDRQLKRKIQQSLNITANVRDMTTRLVCEILTIMNSSDFSDTYSVCVHFGMSDQAIEFGQAFKEQFGGERELTIATIMGKITLKLVEDIARDLGKCIKNSCLNNPSNEEIFKEEVVSKQSSNKYSLDTDVVGRSSSYLFGSMDRSKWGPFHQGMSFYAVLIGILRGTGKPMDDVISLIKYSLLKHALKKFEIHHNIQTSVVRKAQVKKILFQENGDWHINYLNDERPDIKLDDWEIFVLEELKKGKKYVHTRMDMGQGMLHSCSDVYGAVIDNYIKKIISKIIWKRYNAKLEFSSMNTSDDSACVFRIIECDEEKFDICKKTIVFLIDFLQRMSNMYVSEKSVFSPHMCEFKSSFINGGIEQRVMVKFLSTQLTIGKDCFPEDFWNTYNSLVKQVLGNGGSQMMCDLLYLSKLHLMMSAYSLSKSPFKDCILEAPISRFGFPNLTAPDIYYHTSRHIAAHRTFNFLKLCGYEDGNLRIKKDPNKTGKKTNIIIMDGHTNFIVPNEFTSSSNATFKTENQGNQFKTVIELEGASNKIIFHHTDFMTVKSLESNLVRFYTLSQSPGLMDSESIWGGVRTLLPSQRGKKGDDVEVMSKKAMSEMNSWEYYTMRYLPLTMTSAKLKSSQALYQSKREGAKKSHQNMVFAKGLLINSGTFCFFKNEMVNQDFAFCNFDCDDSSIKDITRLVKSLYSSFQPWYSKIKHILNDEQIISIELRNTVTTHESLDIPLNETNEPGLTNDPFLIRAFIRSDGGIEDTLTVSDALMIKNSPTIDVNELEGDKMKFLKSYKNYSDHELMMISMNQEKRTLKGVYMFEQEKDLNLQIETILRNCVHNYVSREFTSDSRPIKNQDVNIENIQRILVYTAILSSNIADSNHLRTLLMKFVSKPELGIALIEGMNNSRYGKWCAIVKLFINPEYTAAERILKKYFRNMKNIEESDDGIKRMIQGEMNGVKFKVVTHVEDQFTVKVRVSPCNGAMKKKLIKQLKMCLDLTNETIELTEDKSLIASSNFKITEEQKICVDFRNNKFVLCLVNRSKMLEKNLFEPEYNIENFNEFSQKSEEKWSRCLEIYCNSPVITDITVLWNLLKTDKDKFLIKEIEKRDFGSFSLEEYQNQYAHLMEVKKIIPKGSTRNFVIASLFSKPVHDVVMKNFYSENRHGIISLCPDSLIYKTNPFSQVFLLCKLISVSETINDVMRPDTFLKVIGEHMQQAQDIPVIKFKGHQVTHMGKIVNDQLHVHRVGEHLNHHQIVRPVIQASSEDIIRNTGFCQSTRTLMVFSRELSVSNLFEFKFRDKDLRIPIINIDTGEIITWDNHRNTGSVSLIDKFITDNPSMRLGLICNDEYDSDGNGTMRKTNLRLDF